MSDVANLGLCRELYELSGWISDDFWQWIEAHQEYELNNGDSMNQEHPEYPAYSLGYLMRKLPHHGLHLNCAKIDNYREFEWSAAFSDKYSCKVTIQCADSPENAAAKLAIELIRRGVLKP